jgi:branched-subunit amino acid ABC-type transport system permease component
MAATTIAQLVVDGLGMGLVYVLLASGINLIIAISGILFIAYGQFYMLGAYITWALMVLFGLPFFVSLAIATVVPALLGGLIYWLIFNRIQMMERRFLNGIVASIGLMMLIGQGALLAFGTASRGVGSVFGGVLNFAGVHIPVEKIVLIALALLILLALHLFLKRTNGGRAMRAVSFDKDVAALQGVNGKRVYLLAMVVGCGLAGFAGGIMAPVFAVSPVMGSITLVVLLVVMLGGIGSMTGAIVAGLILGLTLSFGQYLVGSGLAQILFFVVIGIVLFFRPGGLLGNPGEEIPIDATIDTFFTPTRTAIFGAVLIFLPLFVRSPYYIHLLIMVGINSALAMSFVFLFRTGLISVAVAAFWGIGAYASALMSANLGVPVWISLPASAGISGLVALVTGAFFSNRAGNAFVILTMVFGFIVTLVFGTFDLFGGHVGIFNIPLPEPVHIPFFGTMDFASKVPYYYLMLVLIGLVIAVYSAFYAAWTGRAWRAISLSPRLASSLGVDLFRYRLLAFVIAGATAGLMGSFYAHYYGSVVPEIFDPYKAMYTHVYAILGGLSFGVLGPIVGATVMTFVPELLRTAKEVEPIVTGVIVVLLVMFLPNGVLGLVRRRQRIAANRVGAVTAVSGVRAKAGTAGTNE